MSKIHQRESNVVKLSKFLKAKSPKKPFKLFKLSL
jgi:hypothetical protein